MSECLSIKLYGNQENNSKSNADFSNEKNSQECSPDYAKVRGTGDAAVLDGDDR